MTSLDAQKGRLTFLPKKNGGSRTLEIRRIARELPSTLRQKAGMLSRQITGSILRYGEKKRTNDVLWRPQNAMLVSLNLNGGNVQGSQNFENFASQKIPDGKAFCP